MESKDVSISLLLRSYVTFTHIKSSIIEKPYTHIYVPFFILSPILSGVNAKDSLLEKIALLPWLVPLDSGVTPNKSLEAHIA